MVLSGPLNDVGINLNDGVAVHIDVEKPPINHRLARQHLAAVRKQELIVGIAGYNQNVGFTRK